MASATGDRPGRVREGEELPLEPLRDFLDKTLGAGAGADLEVEQFPGGHSNLTYLLRCGGRELVLRRPPFGSKVKSAHDMGREHRVLSALSPSYPLAPKTIAFCDDVAVIGASFYLMERVVGVILRRDPPAGTELGPSRCATLSRTLIDTLAELHAIDYQAVGLGELGRPVGFVDRQVSGWTARYTKAQTDDIDAIEQVAAWLADNKPSGTRAALIHNDFKLDNIVLDPDDLGAVRGILDWEMCTVGDPWMDLGTSLCYWVEADDPPECRELRFGPTTYPGMWTRRQLVDRYQERSGTAIDNPLFFYAFGLFKTAVVVQQIYYRYAKGLTKDPRFARLGPAAGVLASQAARAIETGEI